MFALVGALFAGLLGSPHCVGMCGGFATAVSDSPMNTLSWHLGRLVSYASLGALAGLMGYALPGPRWLSTGLAALLLGWFSLRLAGLTPQWHWSPPGLAALGGRLLGSKHLAGRFAFGLINGLLPCGLVYAALALPVSLKDPTLGALSMVFFGLGTVPLLSFAAIALQKLAGARPTLRKLIALGVFCSGLWTLSLRSPAAVSDTGEPTCHHVK